MPAYSITEYENLPAPDTVWVWGGILPTSGSALLFGNPKLGKSFLSLGLCEAVADPSISTYLDLPIQQHGRALYIQLDTPRNLWKSGYLAVVRSKVAKDNIFIIDKELPDRPNPFDMRTKAAQAWIRGEVDRIQPVLTIIDTMRRMHRADENDPTTAQLIFDVVEECTVPSARILITHKKKQQHGDNSLGQARGSSTFTGAVDAILNMTKTALHIEARSDVAEEIAIWQRDDGTWAVNTKKNEIMDFVAQVQARTDKMAEVDAAISEEFSVSPRTARRWRTEFGHCPTD